MSLPCNAYAFPSVCPVPLALYALKGSTNGEIERRQLLTVIDLARASLCACEYLPPPQRHHVSLWNQKLWTCNGRFPDS